MASANVVELTTANWDKEVVQSDKPVLVDFWAVWCGPCRALGPTIDRVADQFAGKVKVGKLNTDDHQEIAIKYGISSIPQVLLFKGSDQPLDKLAGLGPEAIVVAIDSAWEQLVDFGLRVCDIIFNDLGSIRRVGPVTCRDDMGSFFAGQSTTNVVYPTRQLSVVAVYSLAVFSSP